MAQTIVKYLIRRGSDLDRLNVVLAQGELGLATDAGTRRLFAGDGVQPGGWPVASKFYLVNNFTATESLRFVQVYDLVFNIGTSSLYALTGTKAPDNILPDNLNPDAYMLISTR